MKSLKGKFVALSLILSLVLVLSLSIQLANSQIRDNFYIRADGSVEGTNNIQRNGNIYTFIGNINNALIVERDNIVIDGSGYVLHGLRNNGIDLSERTNVTLKNAQITLDIGYCINLRNSNKCVITNNTIFSAPPSSQNSARFPSWWSGPIAIEVSFSNDNVIKGNTVSKCYTAIHIGWSSSTNIVTDNVAIDCRIGIEIQDAKGNTLKDNQLSNSSFSVRSFSGSDLINDVDASNTVDDSPVIYWINEKDKVVPPNAAFVVLIDCAGIVAHDLSSYGIIMVSTTNSTLSSAMLDGGTGIVLQKCSGINIVRSTITNQATGISLVNSSNIFISENTITNCNSNAITYSGSHNNIITKNIFAHNNVALSPYHDLASSKNLIIDNNFNKNEYAIKSDGGTADVCNNIFSENNHAIVWTTTPCNLTQNTFIGNGEAISITGSNNFLKNNRLQNNTKNLIITDLTTRYYGYSNPVNVIVNDIDASNTINGRPIIYWVNQHNQIVPSDAAVVILVSCTNITAQNLYLSGNGQGIALIDTKGSEIKGNTIISNDLGVGIFSSSENIFTNNYIAKNLVGMRIADSTDNIIANSSFVENKGEYNGFAIIFTGNQKDNTIIHNDFIDSRVEPMLQISINKYDGPGWGNSWSTNVSGNYWSDYQTRYTNVTELNSSGTGNTPFVINENNIDYHPLMRPLNQVTPAPSPTPLPSASPSISPTETAQSEPTLSPSQTLAPSPLVTSQPTMVPESILPPATLIAVIIVVFCMVAVGVGAFMLRRSRARNS